MWPRLLHYKPTKRRRRWKNNFDVGTGKKLRNPEMQETGGELDKFRCKAGSLTAM
jgi:hypothetical protein